MRTGFTDCIQTLTAWSMVARTAALLYIFSISSAEREQMYGILKLPFRRCNEAGSTGKGPRRLMNDVMSSVTHMGSSHTWAAHITPLNGLDLVVCLKATPPARYSIHRSPWARMAVPSRTLSVDTFWGVYLCKEDTSARLVTSPYIGAILGYFTAAA